MSPAACATYLRPIGEVETPAETAFSNKRPAHGIKYIEGRPTVIFDTICTKNRYSVPPKLARRTVTVVTNGDTIRILYEGVQVAEHRRSYGKRESIIDAQHRIDALQLRFAEPGEYTRKSRRPPTRRNIFEHWIHASKNPTSRSRTKRNFKMFLKSAID